MPPLSYILIFSFLGSIVSLIGGILLLIKEKFAVKISHLLTSFAAGTLLGTVFFDLLPEAQKAAQGSGGLDIFLWVLVGILLFFLLERFIHHHGHGKNHEDKKSIIPMIVIGDSLHNFIDGVAMAATFLVSIPLGIVTSLAVAAHEIPQEIGDFGLMLNKGIAGKKVLLINFFSATVALLGAILTYLSKDWIQGLLPAILALTSGFFIYIAAANLIPEIHLQENRKIAFWETVCLFIGVLVVYFAINVLSNNFSL